MKIEEQVCSFEQSKELKRLGFRLNTLYFYDVVPINLKGDYEIKLRDPQYIRSSYSLDAPNVAELGILLPEIIEIDGYDCYYESGKVIGEGEYWVGWNTGDETFSSGYRCRNDTEALVRTDALIWLINNHKVEIQNLTLD